MKLITKASEIPENFTGIVEFSDGSKQYRVNGEFHREDGPAIEGLGGFKEYWINGYPISKKEFDRHTNSCDGKTVEIDGVKYKLVSL